MIRNSKLLVFFTLFNQMVCPEEINEEKVNKEQEGLCATIKKLCKNSENAFRFGSSTADKEACFPREIIRNISSFLTNSIIEESCNKIGKDIEEKITESLGEKKVKVSNMVFKDGQIEKLTVTIDGIKHEELRPLVIEGKTQNMWIIVTEGCFNDVKRRYDLNKEALWIGPRNTKEWVNNLISKKSAICMFAVQKNIKPYGPIMYNIKYELIVSALR